MKLLLFLVVIAALTAGAGVAWSAVRGGTTPSSTTPTTPSTTAPSPQQPAHHCPNMGSGSGSRSSTAYSTNM